VSQDCVFRPIAAQVDTCGLFGGKGAHPLEKDKGSVCSGTLEIDLTSNSF